MIEVQKLIHEPKSNNLLLFHNALKSPKTKTTQILTPHEIQKDEFNQCINHDLNKHWFFEIPVFFS